MKILQFGFVEVGEWKLDSRLKSGIRYKLRKLQDDRVIYAYAVNETIKYIGVCDSTSTSLQSRMSRYQSMTAGGTNKRIANLIRKAIEVGSKVKIYAFKPDVELQLCELNVDLVKGLENPLIQEEKPEWNIKS